MSDDLDRVKKALADHYSVEAEIGVGGMATVYLAGDLKHDRQVAVKVMRGELATAIGADRFLREVRITARLNHPHILPLLDSGEADGLLYYVMPHVAGGSLRRRFAPEAPLELDAALRIAQQVASALDHAHRLGVVHRDIKPENILLSEGHAVVSDFGIARAVSALDRATLTRTGVPLGTPGYMSPEQAMGIAELDERTDVYGLACVVYEMLVGRTPVVWSTHEGEKVGRFIDAPADHRERLDALPGRVEQVLVRALAVRPADRFTGPLEFADALAAAAEGSGQRLSDADIRRVIGRAAELQAEQPTEGALSMGAVEQIAAEVGIPPARVHEAMGELQRGAAAPSAVAAPKRQKGDKVVIQRSLAGEVAEPTLREMVMEIESTLGIAGHVSAYGNSLTWSPASQGADERKVVISVNSAGGATRIHVEERFELSGWRIFIPGWGGGAGVVAGLGVAAALGLQDAALLLIALPGGFAGAITAVNIYIQGGKRRRRPELEALVDRLAARVEGAALPPGDQR